MFNLEVIDGSTNFCEAFDDFCDDLEKNKMETPLNCFVCTE